MKRVTPEYPFGPVAQWYRSLTDIYTNFLEIFVKEFVTFIDTLKANPALRPYSAPPGLPAVDPNPLRSCILLRLFTGLSPSPTPSIPITSHPTLS